MDDADDDSRSDFSESWSPRPAPKSIADDLLAHASLDRSFDEEHDDDDGAARAPEVVGDASPAAAGGGDATAAPDAMLTIPTDEELAPAWSTTALWPRFSERSSEDQRQARMSQLTATSQTTITH